MSMMVFITHYLRIQRVRWLGCLISVALMGIPLDVVQAQTLGSDVAVLKLERQDEALWLTAQLKFDLPSVVEDALQKGVPIFFVAEVDLMRERWYWSNKKVNTAQRHLRLAYQPLTRRWRVNMASGEISESALGLSLNQNFESLQDALTTVRRISRWKIADATDLEPSARYFVEFRFRLDLAQLPRPLQIGTLGQSDWSISMTANQLLSGEFGK
jgi:hypothetical protein